MALPTDSELGRAWGLSPRTIRRVMNDLKRAGKVTRIPGKGTFVPGIQPHRTIPPPPRESAHRLADTLAEAISRGDLRRGDPLPQVKYIRLQYHVSEKTVMRAYQRLEAQRLVHKVGRRFWVGGFQPLISRSPSHEAYVVTPGREDFARVYTSGEMAPAYRRLERELRACGTCLRCLSYDELPKALSRWLERRSYPGGLVFWHFAWDEYHSRLAPYLRPLFERGSRVPILIDLNHVSSLDRLPTGLKAISRGNFTTNQARATAEFVAGLYRPTVVMLMDGAQVRKVPRYGFLKYQKMVYTIEQYPAQTARVRQVVVSPDGELTPAGVIARVRGSEPGYLQYLHDKYGQGRAPEESVTVVRGCSELVTEKPMNQVWLCATDALAAEALNVLDRSGVKVPRDVAVLTFENSPEYLHLGLSACAPDWDLVGYLMAHALIGDFPLHRTHRGFIRIECPVVERLTTPRRG
jgi:DNA-binding transcriptional regulator YhcF (GntR family)